MKKPELSALQATSSFLLQLLGDFLKQAAVVGAVDGSALLQEIRQQQPGRVPEDCQHQFSFVACSSSQLQKNRLKYCDF